jgi:hypothetical protein
MELVSEITMSKENASFIGHLISKFSGEGALGLIHQFFEAIHLGKFDEVIFKEDEACERS